MNKEKPIIFNTEMVMAILAGNKTQTRRIIKPQPILESDGLFYFNGTYFNPDAFIDGYNKFCNIRSPYEIGQTLWVRKAARLFLKITGIRIEQIQDISQEDAKAEGVDGSEVMYPLNYDGHRFDEGKILYRPGFIELWDSRNKKRGYGWDENPYVWVYDFKELK